MRIHGLRTAQTTCAHLGGHRQDRQKRLCILKSGFRQEPRPALLPLQRGRMRALSAQVCACVDERSPGRITREKKAPRLPDDDVHLRPRRVVRDRHRAGRLRAEAVASALAFTHRSESSRAPSCDCDAVSPEKNGDGVARSRRDNEGRIVNDLTMYSTTPIPKCSSLIVCTPAAAAPSSARSDPKGTPTWNSTDCVEVEAEEEAERLLVTLPGSPPSAAGAFNPSSTAYFLRPGARGDGLESCIAELRRLCVWGVLFKRSL